MQDQTKWLKPERTARLAAAFRHREAEEAVAGARGGHGRCVGVHSQKHHARPSSTSADSFGSTSSADSITITAAGASTVGERIGGIDVVCGAAAPVVDGHVACCEQPPPHVVRQRRRRS